MHELVHVCHHTHTHTHTHIHIHIYIYHRIDVYPHTSKPTNLLFRGNMPVLNGSFAYTEIVASMAKTAQAQNYTFPTNFTLIDVR